MITCNLMGGLGNQLFQIFATISHAMRSRQSFKFLDDETLGSGSTTIRPTYWNNFLSRMYPFLTNSFNNAEMFVVREKEFAYNELPVLDIKSDIMIYGYFQSYKYFEQNYNTICRLIGIEQKRTELLNKLGHNVTHFENVISMHFRIGDYKKIQHVHPLMPLEYYDNCLSQIKTTLPDTAFTIMYFCEDVDIQDVLNIVNPLQEKYMEFTFIRGTNTLEDWEQMLLMSCCHHNIIANSSFSWWAAYFNGWEDKQVYYPPIWFGPTIEHNTKDLCPPSWNKVSFLDT